MRLKILTVATYDGLGLAMLKKSLNDYGFDYAVLCEGQPWRGFGMKIIETVEYLKTLKDYTHFLFTDAYDTYFLSGPAHIQKVYRQHFDGKIVFSTEKGCWPYPEKEILYPKTEHPWRFLNSGGYMAPILPFLQMIEDYPLDYTVDDQAYFTDLFFKGLITLDYDCSLFQSVAFEHPDDFLYNGCLINNKTGSRPSVVHGNGRTPMDKIYKIG